MTIVAFLLLLGVLITVHELGHFLVAKLTGVRVLTFSIGFGPKLVSITRGETEYRIAMLPFGGYVRMYGDDLNEAIPEDQKHRAFLEKPIPQKMAIAAAGPVANLLLPLVLFFGISVGAETVPAATVGTVLKDEPAAAAGLLPGDTITAVDGEAIADFGDLLEAIGARPNQKTELLVTRPNTTAPIRLTVTPKATPSQNPLDDAPVGRIGMLVTKALPVVTVAAGSAAAKAGVQNGDSVVEVNGAAVADRDALFAALDGADPMLPVQLVMERARKPGPDGKAPKPPTEHVAVVIDGDGGCTVDATACDDADDGADDIAELRFAVFDADLEAAPVAAMITGTRAAVKAAVDQQKRRRGLASVDGVVRGVEPDSPAADKGLAKDSHRVVAVDGTAMTLVNELPTALSATPDDVHVIGLVDENGRGAVFSFLMKPASRRELGGQKILGVTLTSAQGGAATITRDVSIAEAARRAVVTTGETIADVAAGYVMLFSGRVGLDQLGGPVMMASIAGEAARSGVEVFVGTMALLSVNLALLNLLPVPVLDGGHLLLFTVEAIRRKRLSVEARLRATKIGMVFVGALMLVAIFNDVASPSPISAISIVGLRPTARLRRALSRACSLGRRRLGRRRLRRLAWSLPPLAARLVAAALVAAAFGGSLGRRRLWRLAWSPPPSAARLFAAFGCSLHHMMPFLSTVTGATRSVSPRRWLMLRSMFADMLERGSEFQKCVKGSSKTRPVSEMSAKPMQTMIFTGMTAQPTSLTMARGKSTEKNNSRRSTKKP